MGQFVNSQAIDIQTRSHSKMESSVVPGVKAEEKEIQKSGSQPNHKMAETPSEKYSAKKIVDKSTKYTYHTQNVSKDVNYSETVIKSVIPL